LQGLKGLGGEHRRDRQRVPASGNGGRSVWGGAAWGGAGRGDAVLQWPQPGPFLPGAVLLAALMAKLFCGGKQFRGQTVTVAGGRCDHDGRRLKSMGGAADVAVRREGLDRLGEEIRGLVEFTALARDDATPLKVVSDAHRYSSPPQQLIRLGGHLFRGFEVRAAK
jgi:hypothetical protein